MHLDASKSTISNQSDTSPIEISSFFWQQLQQHRESLYFCCLKWMGGNSIEAEEALSRAMLKAWEKEQNSARKIKNFKAWLTRLTHNLCVDIHRERRRSINHFEGIEEYISGEEPEYLGCQDTTLVVLESEETRIAICHAIENLPKRLRETFILHYYEERSHQEIVQQQEISYDNVCKRISQARKILRKELKGYFFGKDESKTNREVASNFLFESLQQVRSTQSALATEKVSIGEKTHRRVEAKAKERVLSTVSIFVTDEKAQTEQPHGQDRQGEQIPKPCDDGASKVCLPKSCGKKSVIGKTRNWRYTLLNTLANQTFYHISIEPSQVNKQSDISGNPLDTDAVQGFEGDCGESIISSRSPPLDERRRSL